jgi:hypothetical protein
MPETKVKKKQPKGLGDGGGGKDVKGGGVVQSVLDLQQQIGNQGTVKTVLGPDVPGQFKAKAGRGKGGPLFFASSTYKELSKLLTAYAAKQGAKGSAWRRGQVGTMDNVLDDWFSKKKKGTSESDRSKLAAMTWLQPKVRQEKSALSGAKQTETTTAPEQEPEAPSGMTPMSENVPAPEPEPEPESPYTGVPAMEEAPVDSGGGDAPAQDEPQQYTNYGGVPAKEEVPEPQQSWSKGKTGGGFTSGLLLGGARKKAEDAKRGYQPEGTTAQMFDDDDDDDDDQDQVKEPSSVESDTKVSDDDESQQQNNDQEKSNSVSITSSSSETEEPPIVEKLPDPKYSEYRALDDHYTMEFKRGGVHLADIYNDGIQYGPDVEKIKERVTKGWKWSPRTFDKYWHELERLFGGVKRIGPEKAPKQQLTASMDSDDLFKDVEVSSITKEDSKGNPLPAEEIEQRKKNKRWNTAMAGWRDMKISSVPSRDSESNSYDSSQIRSMEDDKKRQKAKEKFIGEVTDSEALLVKKKSKDEQRAKYMLRLGSTMTRGPKNEVLDTKDMASNFSGNGFGIFVMGQNGQIYVGSHKVGVFHHSSFLAGGNVAAAGEMQVSGGKMVTLTNKSGHYQPRDEHNAQVIGELMDGGIHPKSYKYRVVNKDRSVKEYNTALEYVQGLPFDITRKYKKFFS